MAIDLAQDLARFGPPVSLILERARQQAAQDANFFRRLVYFFELQVPQEAVGPVGSTSFLFPLMLNPTSYILEEPFSVEVTPTQGGGLYVEENGIIQRMIKLRGHTGFKPRVLVKGTAPSVLSTVSPEKKSYDRSLLAVVTAALSGQRHFQYLQDAVFRTYADLKRDPATSEQTRLFFHNPKDDEHWMVVPQSFVLERSAASPLVYNYSIDLLVVDKASAVDVDFSEDKSLLEAIKDVLRMAKSGVDMVNGAVANLTQVTAELRGLVANIESILSAAIDIADRVAEFVSGINDLIQAPYDAVFQLAEEVEAAIATLENLRIQLVENGELTESADGRGAGVVPNSVHNSMLTLMEGLDRIGTHPEAFETPSRKQARENKDRQELASSTNREELDAAAAAAGPRTFQEAEAIGTGLLPGDRSMANAELGVGRKVNQYTGSREYAVAQGDTLVNLAAALLGDARLWQDIAVINGLKPPFVDGQAGANLGGEEPPLPGALGVGQRILIPNFSKAPQALPLLPVLGVRLEEPSETHLLGQDLAVVPVAGSRGALFDVPVDTELGSIDARLVGGIDNLRQAIVLRITTERGTDILYKRVGLQRIVALGITPVDLETVRFRIAEAVTADPRVASVRRVTFDQPGDDVVAVDLDAEVRGFAESTNVRAAIAA